MTASGPEPGNWQPSRSWCCRAGVVPAAQRVADPVAGERQGPDQVISQLLDPRLAPAPTRPPRPCRVQCERIAHGYAGAVAIAQGLSRNLNTDPASASLATTVSSWTARGPVGLAPSGPVKLKRMRPSESKTCTLSPASSGTWIRPCSSHAMPEVPPANSPPSCSPSLSSGFPKFLCAGQLAKICESVRQAPRGAYPRRSAQR